MEVSTLKRRIAGWVAIAAILLASLAPALSHALGDTGGAGWTEVCTAQGSKWVQAEGDAPAPQLPHASGLDHCPYCSIHASTLGLPPAPWAVVAPPSIDNGPFAGSTSTPHASRFWPSAHPRAPPHLS